jgi:hypothetical protein
VVLNLIAPTITPNPTSLTFSAVQGSGVVTPASQTVSFTSNGATLPITVASALPSWLNVTVSGQSATFTPILGSLHQGTYYATVLFFAAGAANSTIPVNVQLVVAPPQSCVITFNGGASTSISLPSIGTTTGGFIPLTSNTIAVASNGAPACGNVTWTTSLATICAANAPNGVCPTWAAITGGSTGSLTAGGNISFTAMSNPKTAARQSTITLTFAGGTSAIAPITLTLNEAADTTETQAFREVRALYQTILGRDPDQAGFNFWTGQGAAALGSLTDSFLESPESLGTDWITMLTYQGATGVAPSFSQFLQSVAAIRSGAQTPSSLFTSLAPAGLTVTQVYNNLLSRNPTSAELAASATPLAAFNTIIASSEFQTGADSKTHTNTLFIRLLYYVTLSRDPDAGGLNFWVGVANSVGNGVFYTSTSAGRINNLIGTGSTTGFLGFVGSPEFQFLFQ